ncbi:Two-component response regulator SSK1p [Vermiconidia calcicola]|uniref:Two-component response regulator SSK1p n=1 Tax=Vermiconidia calcicola TaxID=1690605 RepID=A0ACC3NNJ3_9PEZI|nr:Two-component response regulator SSK1p [Vermiconidia calcicola]
MARFRPSRLFRRFSSRSDTHDIALSTERSSPPLPVYSASTSGSRQVRKSNSLPKLKKKLHAAISASEIDADVPEVPELDKEQREHLRLLPEAGRESTGGRETPYRSESDTLAGERSETTGPENGEKEAEVEVKEGELKLDRIESIRRQPILVVQQPTPDVVEEVRAEAKQIGRSPPPRPDSGEITPANTSPSEGRSSSVGEASSSRGISPTNTPETEQSRPPQPTDSNIRPPSIVDSADAKIVNTLLDAPTKREVGLPTSGSSNLPTSASTDSLPAGIQNIKSMMYRKIWVKRNGASATLVQIREDDLVDDARETILRKYANSLGKTFDAPDMTLHIVTRLEPGQQQHERLLGPEEEMCRTIDSYYPGGQTVNEALIISTPQRRTPRPSPRINYSNSYQALDEYRPLENGTDYFPQMPSVIPTTIPQTTGSHDSRSSHHPHPAVAQAQDHPRSMSVLNTGQIPPLPSPGGQSWRHQHRPKYQRQPTSSPTILAHPTGGTLPVNPTVNNAPQHLVHRQSTRPRLDSISSEGRPPNGTPMPPPLPTPPAPEAPPTNKDNSAPPTPSGAAPALGPHNHRISRPKKPRKPTAENQLTTYSRNRKMDSSSASSPRPVTSGIGLLDGSVPPINVLIVEDNIINLRILEGLMKRLKVRWQTAMNGQIAVDKWKAGGFHLVLMDIQMPVMTGLQATKEIRRLERVNGIGVFSQTSPSDEGPDGVRAPGEADGAKNSKDDDKLVSSALFKSPIIIVALTASSLQSDRHEALAAGCNDFLTKPVNFVWLERKVKEWGCMQALIDFDGWRRWKDYAEKAEAGKSAEEKEKDRLKEEKEKIRAEKMAKLQEKQAKAKEEKERKAKRGSLNDSEAGSAGGNGNLSPASAKAVDGGGSEMNGVPPSLRPGTEVLSESNFELS